MFVRSSVISNLRTAVISGALVVSLKNGTAKNGAGRWLESRMVARSVPTVIGFVEDRWLRLALILTLSGGGHQQLPTTTSVAHEPMRAKHPTSQYEWNAEL